MCRALDRGADAGDVPAPLNTVTRLAPRPPRSRPSETDTPRSLDRAKCSSHSHFDGGASLWNIRFLNRQPALVLMRVSSYIPVLVIVAGFELTSYAKRKLEPFAPSGVGEIRRLEY